jgi:hypothetical protein
MSNEEEGKPGDAISEVCTVARSNDKHAPPHLALKFFFV